jgi:hypothetical protein
VKIVPGMRSSRRAVASVAADPQGAMSPAAAMVTSGASTGGGGGGVATGCTVTGTSTDANANASPSALIPWPARRQTPESIGSLASKTCVTGTVAVENSASSTLTSNRCVELNPVGDTNVTSSESRRPATPAVSRSVTVALISYVWAAAPPACGLASRGTGEKLAWTTGRRTVVGDGDAGVCDVGLKESHAPAASARTSTAPAHGRLGRAARHTCAEMMFDSL